MTQRTAALDLDWDDQGIPSYEEAPLTFDIPGYEYDHAHSDVAITVRNYYSDTFGFAFNIEGLKSPRGEYAELWNDVDFGIPDGDTVEEMMRAAENITPQEIADALAANNYAPDDEEDDTTASRHASKRAASLNLNWGQDGDDYVAQLPAIPGYPEMHDEESLVYVAPVGDGYTFWMEIAVLKSEFIKLTDLNFNLPNAKTADEMMQEVDSLTIQDILDALSAVGCGPIDATASRHASDQPTLGLNWEHGDPASTLGDMGLDWTRSLDDDAEYEAWLPVLPGYPEMHEKSSLVYVAPRGGEYTFWMELSLMEEMQPVVLTDLDFDLPHAKTADEMMQEVETLTIQDILDALTNIGWPPESGDATASTASRKTSIEHEGNHKEGNHMVRKATKRTAGMSLDWVDTGSGSEYEATLPNIPGYPGSWCATVWEDDDEYGDPGYDWNFTIFEKGAASVLGVDPLDNYSFDLEEAARPEEMMAFIEGLSPQDIADVLAENGYMPDED